MKPRCWLWQRFSSCRFDSRISTRQDHWAMCVCWCVCELLSLKTREHHWNVGMFPSTPNCSHSNTENRAVLGQHGQMWAPVKPRLLLLCFWFPHSVASQRANKPSLSNGDWRLGCHSLRLLSSTLLLAAGATRKLFLSSYFLPSSPL